MPKTPPKRTINRPMQNLSKRETLSDASKRRKLKRLLALKAQLAKDPLATFKPNEIQEQYLKSQARCRMLHGMNQGGKSTISSVEMRYYLECNHPHRPTWEKAEYFCLVPSKDQARKIYGRYLLNSSEMRGPGVDQPILRMDRTVVDYVRDSKLGNVPKLIRDKQTGCTLEFFWSDWSGTVKKIRGMMFAGGWIDEDGGTVALLNELHPRMMKAMRRWKGGGFITWVVTECGINQAQEEFLARCLDEDEAYDDWQEWRMLRGMKGDPIGEEVRAETELAMSEREAKIRMHGTASAAEFVKIFPYLKDRDKYILEKRYEPTKKDNIWVSMDQGMDHPTAIVIGHTNERSPKQLVITKAIELIGQPLREIVQSIIDYLCGRRMRGLVYDKQHDKRNWDGVNFSDQLWDLMKSPDLWVGVNNYHGPWIDTCDQSHIVSIANLQNFLCPPVDVYHEPMLVFDRPSATNGIVVAYGQLERWRGRVDADYEGPHGIYKKGVGDDFCDAIRNLCMFMAPWRDFGWNLPDASYAPERYELPEKQKAPVLTPEEKLERARHLACQEMVKMVESGENPVFNGPMPEPHELKLLRDL